MAITKSNAVITANRFQTKWETITESDTPTSQKVSGGKYTCTAQGTWGGGALEFKYSQDDSAFHSIDSTNLTFNADGSYNIEIADGYVKPVRTGGTSMDVDAYLTPITGEVS